MATRATIPTSPTSNAHPRTRAGRRATPWGPIERAHLLVDASTGSVVAVLPTLQSRFKLSTEAVSGLLALFSIAALLTQPLAGRLADRVGARRAAWAGACIAVGSLSTLAVLPHRPAVYAALVVGGLGASAFHPAGMLLAEDGHRGDPDRAVGRFGVAGMVGVAIGPLVASALLAMGRARLLPLIALVALWAIRRDRAVPHGGDDQRPPASRVPTTFRLNRDLAQLTGAGVLAALASTAFLVTAPIWVADHHPDRNELRVGLVLVSFQAAGVAGLALGSARRDRWRLERTAPLLLVGSMASLTAAMAFDPGGPSSLGLTALGSALGAATVPVQVLAAQAASRGATGTATGLVTGFANGAGGLLFVGLAAVSSPFAASTLMLAGFSALLPAAALLRGALRGAGSLTSPAIRRGAVQGAWKHHPARSPRPLDAAKGTP